MKKLLDLQEIASRLKTVDIMIMELVLKRMELAGQVADFKRQSGEPIFRAAIEDSRINEVRDWATRHGLNPHFAETIEYLLINESCKLQMIQLQTIHNGLDSIVDEEERYGALKQNLLVLTERWSDTYDTKYDDYVGTKAHLQFEHSLISEMITDLPDQSLLLDVGCATGKVALKYAHIFDKVLGFDLSEPMIKKARSSAELLGVQESVCFEVCDLENGIPVSDETASLLVMNLGTASDVRNISFIVSESLRTLKPGARFLFSFYNRDALMNRWDIIPWSTGLAASVNIYKDTLDVHLLNKQNMEEVLSIYARAYSVSEVEQIFAQHNVDIEIVTHPTMSSILPNELLCGQEAAQELITSTDLSLLNSGFGAYIIVTGKK